MQKKYFSIWKDLLCMYRYQWQIQGRGTAGPPPFPYVQTKLRPKGPEKIFCRLPTPPPPLYLRVWMTACPPPPPYLKVWLLNTDDL